MTKNMTIHRYARSTRKVEVEVEDPGGIEIRLQCRIQPNDRHTVQAFHRGAWRSFCCTDGLATAAGCGPRSIPRAFEFVFTTRQPDDMREVYAFRENWAPGGNSNSAYPYDALHTRFANEVRNRPVGRDGFRDRTCWCWMEWEE